MKPRWVVLTIDTVVELFRDYLTDNEIPAGTKAVKLMFKPTERGKLAIVAYSDEWVGKSEKEMHVHFDLRKSYVVGGSA